MEHSDDIPNRQAMLFALNQLQAAHSYTFEVSDLSELTDAQLLDRLLFVLRMQGWLSSRDPASAIGPILSAWRPLAAPTLQALSDCVPRPQATGGNHDATLG